MPRANNDYLPHTVQHPSLTMQEEAAGGRKEAASGRMVARAAHPDDKRPTNVTPPSFGSPPKFGSVAGAGLLGAVAATPGNPAPPLLPPPSCHSMLSGKMSAGAPGQAMTSAGVEAQQEDLLVGTAEGDWRQANAARAARGGRRLRAGDLQSGMGVEKASPVRLPCPATMRFS